MNIWCDTPFKNGTCRCMMADNYDPRGAVDTCASELNINASGRKSTINTLTNFVITNYI